MNNKIQTAIDHLNKILPLVERQKKLRPEHADVYKKILNSYIELGRTLNKAEIAEQVDNVGDVIDTLRINDMVVFDENKEPIGAYPFTMEQRDHKVRVNGHTVYSMCALDALAISPMFNIKTHIDSTCKISGEEITIDQIDQEILNKEESKKVCFGIDWNSAANNCCATSLCTEMIFLKDKITAEIWLNKDNNREIFTIDEAIQFASGFFKPLISPG